jgi:hypothetical protein
MLVVHMLCLCVQLQHRAFDVAGLNAICEELTPKKWFNPHKSIFGVGNYDINVIMRALSTYGLVVRWFDRRKSIAELPFESLYGIILNIPSSTLSAFGARHWLCIKRFGSGAWYRMDSDAPTPDAITRRKGDQQTPKEKATRIDDVRATSTEHKIARCGKYAAAHAADVRVGCGLMWRVLQLVSHLSRELQLADRDTGSVSSSSSNSSSRVPSSSKSASQVQVFLIELVTPSSDRRAGRNEGTNVDVRVNEPAAIRGRVSTSAAPHDGTRARDRKTES